ncbi:OmpL47-type beta-barrel domain-containing protein [Polymorphospora lycopeni]|uniref:Chitobiase/beta-hexosaminidase C-terminal domain-containing protein n=1 Tax=Polymorphospora lycopeni TaxID=3140240 RepID=A0ABV5CRW9_9ACTN
MRSVHRGLACAVALAATAVGALPGAPAHAAESVQYLQTGSTLTNLWGSAPAEFWYSSHYQGVLQTLDHVLVTDGLDDTVVDFRYAPINTDYADRFGTDGHKAADHNPAVLTLEVEPPADTTPPTAAATTLSPDEPNGDDNRSYHTPVTVTLTGADEGGSGVRVLQYAIDGEAWTRYKAPLTISAPGRHVVKFRAIDLAGNRSEIGNVIVTITPDACPDSDKRWKIWLGNVNSGVANGDLGNGCAYTDILYPRDRTWAATRSTSSSSRPRRTACGSTAA